jgi:hypothetical protein
MSNLSSGAQWGIILGGYFGSKLLGQVGRQNPEAAPFILPIQLAYAAFVLATWLADPLFNLLLRLDRFGRYALTRRQTWASNVLGLLLVAAVAAAAAGVGGLGGARLPWYALAAVFVLLALPAAGCFRLADGWPTVAMTVLTAGLAVLGLSAVGLAFAAVAADDAGLTGAFNTAAGAFLLGVLLSQFANNALRGVQPAR